MIITIAGCGALGTLLAARLIAGGATVQLLQRKGAQLAALQADGIVIEADRDGGETRLRAEAVVADPQELRPADLAIILVKSTHTAALTGFDRLLAPGGLALSLQNGLGNAEQLTAAIGADRVLAGCCTYGAFRRAPGRTVWGGDGEILLGAWSKNAGDRAAGIVAALLEAGLNAKHLADPRPALWRKLVINVMINPISALTGLRNGQLAELPELVQLAQRLGEEAITAAARNGVALEAGEVMAAHKAALQGTAGNKSSMLQDMEAQRPSEVAAILGPVIAAAGNEDEFPDSRRLHALIKGRERSWQ